MINNKSDYLEYLEADRIAYGKPKNLSIKEKIVNVVFPDNNYEYVKCLRKLEYIQNSGGKTIARILCEKKLSKLGTKSGICMCANVADKGLHITHGKIVVNENSKIGEFCKINSDVTIGGYGRYDISGAPTIGNRVYSSAPVQKLSEMSILLMMS